MNLFMLIAVQIPRLQRDTISLSKLKAWSSSITSTFDVAYLGFLPSKEKRMSTPRGYFVPTYMKCPRPLPSVGLYFSRAYNRRLAD